MTDGEGKSFWARWQERRRAAAAERADERAHMSPAERAFTSESVDDRQAELESEAHFGGDDLQRMRED